MIVQITPKPITTQQENNRRVVFHNSTECVDRIIPHVNEYFDHIYAHRTYSTAYERAMFVYATTTCRLYITNTIRLPTLRDTKLHNKLLNHCCFFDFPSLPDTIDTREGDYLDAVKILLPVQLSKNKRVLRLVAYYIPLKKCLITSDWTHTDTGADFFVEHMMSALFETLGLKRNIQRLRPIKPTLITIGADPEYELFSLESGNIVKANSVIYGTGGSIGLDGAQMQVEFRPAASVDPETLANRLENLTNTFTSTWPRHRLAVSGHVYPLGGHIHIGVGKAYEPPSELLAMYDDFLGRQWLNLSGDARSSYKRLSAYETKSWGFEYRSLPAIVFHNKELSRVCFKLMKNLTSAFINTRKVFTYNRPVELIDLVSIGRLTDEEAKFYQSENARLSSLVSSKNVILADFESNKLEKGYKYPVIKHNETDEDMIEYREPPTTQYTSPRLIIAFSDDWNQSLTMRLRSEIQTSIGDTLTSSFSLVLFGLRSDRGDVSNIPTRSFGFTNDISCIPTGSVNTLKVGLPRSFRMGEPSHDVFTDVVNSIKECITARINNTLESLIAESTQST